MFYYMIDQDLNIVDGIEMFESMIWTEKFSEVGDFELYLPATPESVKLYTEAANKHYYIVRAEDADNLTNLPAMEVETVETDVNVKDHNKLIITGKQIKNILYRRIVDGNTALAGPIQNEIRRIVKDNAISPTDVRRVIPRLDLGPETPGLENIIVNADAKGTNIAALITAICKDKKIGWDIRLDFLNKKLIFVLTKPTDRRSEVIFSNDFNNLISTEYTLDTDSYRNIAIVDADYIKVDKVTGRSEVINNKQTVKLYGSSEEETGLNRYELYVDGSNEANNAKDYNRAFQSSVLVTKGRTELEKYKVEIDVTGEVEPNLTFVLNRDYFLGDLVKIKNEYGMEYDARVTSITSSLSAKKNTLIPSFSVEDWTGKEKEKDTSIKEEEMRITEDGQPRADEYGYARIISTGIEYRDRITEDGSNRISEDGIQIETAKNDYFDDEKYN